MIRRVLALAVVTAGLTSMSACSTVDKPAATVNGTEISMADFADDVEALKKSELGQQGIGFGVDADQLEFTNGDAARNWLRLRIFDVAISQAVEERGEPLPADALEATRAQFTGSPGWDQFSPQLQASILNIAVGGDPEIGLDLVESVRSTLATADIDIASSIGRWDAESLQVVPAGL